MASRRRRQAIRPEGGGEDQQHHGDAAEQDRLVVVAEGADRELLGRGGCRVDQRRADREDRGGDRVDQTRHPCPTPTAARAATTPARARSGAVGWARQPEGWPRRSLLSCLRDSRRLLDTRLVARLATATLAPVTWSDLTPPRLRVRTVEIDDPGPLLARLLPARTRTPGCGTATGWSATARWPGTSPTASPRRTSGGRDLVAHTEIVTELDHAPAGAGLVAFGSFVFDPENTAGQSRLIVPAGGDRPAERPVLADLDRPDRSTRPGPCTPAPAAAPRRAVPDRRR